jgi:hypothetical protein
VHCVGTGLYADVNQLVSSSLRGGSDDLSVVAIASRSLSSGAHSRDPLARNDDVRVGSTTPRSRGTDVPE